MQVTIVATNFELRSGQSSHVQQRVEYALDRFAHEVRTLDVVFTDENGPKGGEDISCQIKAVGDQVGAVVARAVHETPEQAVADAVKRVARQVADHLDRQGSRHRRAS